LESDDVVLIPVFDDWASLTQLLPQIDDELAKNSRAASVILVDDGSVQSPQNLSITRSFFCNQVHRYSVAHTKYRTSARVGDRA
jgi:hypothetical protein